MASLLDKQTVLVDGLDKQETQLHRAIYTSLRNGDFESYDLATRTYNYFMAVTGHLGIAAHQINDARYKRIQRLRNHIKSIIKDGDAIFITLTFTDAVLASTSAETRRRYVSRFLKASCSSYVANKDFGEINQREHYHAVVKCDALNYKLWHLYGAINGKRIRNRDKDIEACARYVAKLTFHSIKKTAAFERIIYSR